MIAKACLFQAIYFGSYYANMGVSELDLNKLLAYSISTLTTNPAEIKWYSEFMVQDLNPKLSYSAFKLQIFCHKVLVIASTYLQFAANSVILVDLYLTLKNPFYPRNKRVPVYNIFLLLVFIFILTNIIYAFIYDEISLNLYDIKS
jgi:hypothetical protein